MGEKAVKSNSIARKINLHFLWREIGGLLGFYFFTVVGLVITFVVATDIRSFGNLEWDYRHHFVETLQQESSFPEKIAGLTYMVEGISESGREVHVEVAMGAYVSGMLAFSGIFFCILILRMVTGLMRGAKEVREMLQPIQEMAERASEISNKVYESTMHSSSEMDESKYQNLEEAIGNIKVNKPDARIDMQDADLDGIEKAINDLLDRMRENYKQQTQFVSDASHELRTPIAVIQGYVNMLDRWGKEDEKILTESIEAIQNEANHMQRLVEQLLFLARGDSGRQNLKMEENDLAEILRIVFEESMMIDEAHRYHLEINGKNAMQSEENDRILVLCDKDMLKQSMRILIDNAAKYTKEGYDIILRAGMNEKEHPFFCIQDEGIGMSQSDAMHVFDRFFRADAVRNSKTGGTGLGLSIAKWIIDKHGGQVEVVSREGLGSRFTVILPKQK